jgi:uncharacterized protein with ParB-like and HNH nuclease domain
MNSQQICLKTVDDLRVDPKSNAPLEFFIPSYQRGYRWLSLQVTQLLEDIREFTQRGNPQPEEFYCLQPLVIKVHPSGKFEVVDGQQRLTTLLLILRHFNERLTEKYKQELFTLAYETRLNLDEFLMAPVEETANDNVDYFHLYNAIRAIEDWFGQRESEVEAIKSALLNKTKVIWFELAERDNPVDAFTRLNVGKIPLTNDELIRALFLRRTGPDDKDAANVRMRIAYEWDQLEKGLQSDDFWYFLSNRSRSGQNRIGFIFDLVARAEGMSDEMATDAYGLFYTFNQRLKEDDATPESEWLKIRQTYLMLEEWFEDRTLYHMVGFLVSQDMPIETIRELSQDCTKSAFQQRLRGEIFRRVIGKEMSDPSNEDAVRMDVADHLETLTYGSSSHSIAAALLLFNVATLLQNQRSNLRFQFDSFKTEYWDIEHIRSVADDKPERYHQRKDWLRNCLGYLEEQDAEADLCSKIEDFLDLSQVEATNERFDSLYEEILQLFGEATEGEVVHGIANLTLLDEHTNRSYKNAPFAVKRQQLLDLDQHGIFVPLCTRNVFLKCYSPQVDNVMFWSDEDQQGYQEAITNVLVNFFCGKQEGNL